MGAGGGLLVLPLAMHHASVVVGVLLLIACAAASAFTANLVALGCEMTASNSLPEAFANVVVGPDQELMTDEAVERKTKQRRRISMVLEVMVALYTLGMLIMYVRVVADIL